MRRESLPLSQTARAAPLPRSVRLQPGHEMRRARSTSRHRGVPGTARGLPEYRFRSRPRRRGTFAAAGFDRNHPPGVPGVSHRSSSRAHRSDLAAPAASRAICVARAMSSAAKGWREEMESEVISHCTQTRDAQPQSHISTRFSSAAKTESRTIRNRPAPCSMAWRRNGHVSNDPTSALAPRLAGGARRFRLVSRGQSTFPSRQVARVSVRLSRRLGRRGAVRHSRALIVSAILACRWNRSPDRLVAPRDTGLQKCPCRLRVRA